MKHNGTTSSDLAETLIQATYGKSSRANAAENIGNDSFQRGYLAGQKVGLTESGCFEAIRVEDIRLRVEQVNAPCPTVFEKMRDYKRGLWSARYQLALR